MTTPNLLLLTIVLLTTSCHEAGNRQRNAATETAAIKPAAPNKAEQKAQTTEIDCDTVYKNSGYKITLAKFYTTSEDETQPNSVFTLLKESHGQRITLYTDSIYTRTQEIHFSDFNGDQVKDILIQNSSDVRSNWTYYLYLVDTTRNTLKKIRGFQEIKNPNYLPEHDLIDNYVVSGKNWTSFYKITADSVKNFDAIVYDDQAESGTHDQDYQKAVRKILKTDKK